MKRSGIFILTTMVIISMVCSSSVFAAEKDFAFELFLGQSLTNDTAAVEAASVGVEYRGHVENKGDFPLDESWIQGPAQLGTVGESLRLEAFWIRLTDTPAGLHIKYQVHVQNKGWMDPVVDGNLAGTEGEGLRIEAINIELVDDNGEPATGYSVEYKGHIQNQGDTEWVADGVQLGTVGSSLRLEALEIRIVKLASDMTAYEAAVASAGALAEATYTADSWAALQITLTENVVTEENTQEEVDAATANITAAIEALQELMVIESVTPVTTTKIQVKLSNSVDGVETDNFSIEGLTISAVALAEDNRTVTLTTSPATPEASYTIAATGLMINTVVQADTSLNYTMPDVNVLYKPTLTAVDDTLTADGESSTQVTYMLKDAEGNILTEAENVVVAFTSTFGNFDQRRVTVQDGQATVKFTSENLTEESTAVLNATIIQASDSSLLGLTPAQTAIALKPDTSEPADPEVTVSFYDSITPGKYMVLVQIASDTPENYTVFYDGVELLFSESLDGFTGDILDTVEQNASLAVVTEIISPEPDVMPAATVAWYSSLTPGKKTVQVVLDTTTPELYAVTYNGTALTYSERFGGYIAEVATTVAEDLEPVVTLV